jgi:CHAD domain-containing protein/CYTH domain-containing protein
MRIEDRTIELPAEEGARVVILGLLEEAKVAAGAFAAGKGDEPLHDFRVAVRRLRSGLRSLRPWVEESVRRRHEKELKRIARSTNEARDAEVQLAWLRGKRDAFASARLRPGFDDIVAWFEARARSGPDAGRVAKRFGRIAAKLRKRLGSYERRIDPGADGPASFGGVLAALVEDQIASLEERIDAIPDGLDEETVHRARIEGKRLRYLLEPLRGYGHADAGEAVRRLKRLQDVLGELHDAHVLAGELGDVLVEAASERARAIHAAAYGASANGAPLRDGLRGSPRPGLLALVHLVRERRDALYAELDHEWRPRGVNALAAEARTVAAALAGRSGGKVEREARFLLTALPPRAEAEQPSEIAQGWLPGSRLHEWIRRMRTGDGERYWRAVEQGSGRARLEAEEESSREIFDALWPFTEGRRVAKRRYRVHDGSLVWQIDEFTDRELVLAEVGLAGRAKEVQLPDWLRPLVVREITAEPAYLEVNLATEPASPASAHAVGGAPPAADDAPQPQVKAEPSPEP